MEVDAALEIVAKSRTDFSIKNRFPRGVSILLALCAEHEELGERFEHDQMWIGDFAKTVRKMPKVTVVRMSKLGWFEDEGSWSHF